MVQSHRFARGHGHRPAAGLTGSAGTAGQRGTSSGCCSAPRSPPRSPAPRDQAAGPVRPPDDDPGAPSRPGTWPSPCSAPTGDPSSATSPADCTPLVPPGRGRGCWPAVFLEQLQHCSLLLIAITPPGARPPNRVAHQVMIPAHHRTG